MLPESVTLKFREVLRARERVSRADAQSYQRELGRLLLLHARAQVPFYRERLAPALQGEKFDFDAWSFLPFLTRTDLQNRAAELHARLIPPFAGDVKTGTTSGSTGRPLRYRHEELHDAASAAQTDRFFDWWGLKGKNTLATFRSTYDESARRGAQDELGWKLGDRRGMRYMIELMSDIDSQLDWLVSIRPDYVMARGGIHISELALHARRRGISLPLKCLISLGGLVTERARELARQAFKRDIADSYGASEAGMIACQCPECGLYHTCDETIIVETLRPDGTPCAENELGRVVITPLYAYAMPMIRYEIGDYAVRGPDKAPCGRILSSLISIGGRYRNVFVLKDGRVVQPYANASKIGAHLSYRQIQLVQTAYDEIEIRYVPADGEQRADIAGLEHIMSQILGGPATVKLKPLDRIESGPGGKFEETLSLVAR